VVTIGGPGAGAAGGKLTARNSEALKL